MVQCTVQCSTGLVIVSRGGRGNIDPDPAVMHCTDCTYNLYNITEIITFTSLTRLTIFTAILVHTKMIYDNPSWIHIQSIHLLSELLEAVGSHLLIVVINSKCDVWAGVCMQGGESHYPDICVTLRLAIYIIDCSVLVQYTHRGLTTGQCVFSPLNMWHVSHGKQGHLNKCVRSIHWVSMYTENFVFCTCFFQGTR